MAQLIRIVLLGAVILFPSACDLDFLAVSQMPNDMPANARMTYSSDGGMAPAWIKIEVSKNRLLVKEKKADQERETIRACVLKADEVELLYASFVQNKFDTIENLESDEIVYDAGSTSIRIRYSKESRSVSSGQNSPLSPTNSARFNAIGSLFKQIVKNNSENLLPVDKSTAQP